MPKAKPRLEPREVIVEAVLAGLDDVGRQLEEIRRLAAQLVTEEDH